MNAIYYVNKLSKIDYDFLVSVSMIFSQFVWCFIGGAIWFMEPIILCKVGDIEYKCFKQEACSSNIQSYRIDNINSPQSLTTEFHLICEREWMVRWCQSLIFLGGIFGPILDSQFTITSEQRKRLIIVLCYISTTILILITFSDNVFFISLGYAISQNFCYSLFMVHTMAYANEILDTKIEEIVIIYMNIGVGITGIFYPILSYLTQSNWKCANIFQAILMSFSAYYFQTSETHQKQVNQEKLLNKQSFEQCLLSDGQIQLNMFILILQISAFYSTINVINLEVENLGGNFYFNFCLIALFELSGGFVTFYLIKLYNIIIVNEKSILILGISMTFFIFLPFKIVNVSMFYGILLLLLMCLIKLSLEIIVNASYGQIQYYIPKTYTQKCMQGATIFSRSTTAIVPQISFICKNLNIHPFAFYGVFHLFTLYIMQKYKKLYKNIESSNNELEQAI